MIALHYLLVLLFIVSANFLLRAFWWEPEHHQIADTKKRVWSCSSSRCLLFYSRLPDTHAFHTGGRELAYGVLLVHGEIGYDKK
jgi:hypothetical protein